MSTRGKRVVAAGRRVFLRPPAPRDRAEFLALVRASRRLHRPWVYPPDTPRRFAAYCRRAPSPGRARFLVCLREGGAVVGAVNLSEIVRGALRSAFLGYYGFAGHTGRGYMTEGVALALAHAFRVLQLHRVEANIQPGNRSSIALARRCGFRREGFSPKYLKVGGRWRDHGRWALLAEEFRGRRARRARA